jgi:hypothetical protein
MTYSIKYPKLPNFLNFLVFYLHTKYIPIWICTWLCVRARTHLCKSTYLSLYFKNFHINKFPRFLHVPFILYCKFHFCVFNSVIRWVINQVTNNFIGYFEFCVLNSVIRRIITQFNNCFIGYLVLLSFATTTVFSLRVIIYCIRHFISHFLHNFLHHMLPVLSMCMYILPDLTHWLICIFNLSGNLCEA